MPDQDVVTVMPRPPGPSERPVAGLAVWQGWRMQWQYNHRLNRTGALLEQLPCPALPDEPPVRCRARIISTAASGTGTDRARLESHHALVVARGVRASSAAKEVLLQGPEGRALESRTEIRVPLTADAARQPLQVALLSGFDVAAMGSADKLQRFAIQVDPPQVGEDEARVPVTIAGRFDCNSAECPRANEVSLSILVGVTLLSSQRSELSTSKHTVNHGYAWNEKTELPAERTVAHVRVEPDPGRSAQVWAVEGFDVQVDAEMHVVDFGLQVSADGADRGRVAMLVRNWKEGMKGARPPMSWFAFKQAGRAEWNVRAVRLAFRSASVARQRWKTELPWDGRGKPALAPEGERVRMLHWQVSP